MAETLIAQSSHQIYPESFLHPASIIFAADFDPVDVSSVVFCFF